MEDDDLDIDKIPKDIFDRLHPLIKAYYIWEKEVKMGKVNLEFLKDDIIKYEITGKNQEDILDAIDRMLNMLK